jgi:hypothetical protein
MVSWAEWQGLTALVISITFAIISLAYTIGIGFHMPKLQAWAKNEMYQAFGSLFIAAMMFAIVEGLTAFMNELGATEPVGCPVIVPYTTTQPIFHAVSCYIANLIQSFLATLGSTVGAEIVLGLIASTTFKAQPYQLGFSVSYGAGLAPLTSLISLAVSSAAAGAWLMDIQLILLKLIENNILILFPIGIFLRSFPFTRAAGGTLIGISIGLYLIYPLMWLFDAYVYTEGIAETPPPFFTLQTLTDCIHFNLMACAAAPFNILTDILKSILFPLFYYIIYNLVIYAMMLPIFNLIVTIIVIGDLAELLGGQIDPRALTKLI